MKTKKLNQVFRIAYNSLFIIVISLAITQCSSSNLTTNNNTYTLSLGDVEESGFQQLVRRVENIYHYELERNEQYRSSEAFIRTFWKKSPPFSDDPTFKAEQVETRLILRSKSKNSQGYRMYSIKFIGEYRALMSMKDGGKEFQKIPLTQEAEDYFKDIAYDLRDRVRGSIRGY